MISTLRRQFSRKAFCCLVFCLSVGMLSGPLWTGQAAQGTVVPAGFDLFETPDNQTTTDSFQDTPIPANFFGPGSLAYTGTVTFKGGPPVDPNLYGSADTVIERLSDVTTPGSTNIRIVGLSLVSASPITVEYQGGAAERWDVASSISTTTPSTGSMTIRGGSSGGTFDSTLKVFPKFTFTGPAGQTRTLDTGSPVVQSAMKQNAPFAERCAKVIEDINPTPVNGASAPAPSPQKCPPITFSTTNTPWSWCGTHFCPPPFTEADRLAAHGIGPPRIRPIIVTGAPAKNQQ